MTAIVYVATNKINNKFYIGVTQRGLRQRRSRHIWSALHGRNGALSAAIRKYGPRNFTFCAICECSDLAAAFDKEKQYIAALDPHYNLTKGGDGVIGYQYSPEQKKASVAARRSKSGYKNSHRYRAVRCLTDNTAYSSLTEAAQHYGLSKAMLHCLCNKTANSSRGLEFEYAEITNV